MKKESHQKKIHINLPEDLHKRLRIKCAYEDMTIQGFVEGLVREELAEYSALPSAQVKGQNRHKITARRSEK